MPNTLRNLIRIILGAAFQTSFSMKPVRLPARSNFLNFLSISLLRTLSCPRRSLLVVYHRGYDCSETPTLDETLPFYQTTTKTTSLQLTGHRRKPFLHPQYHYSSLNMLRYPALCPHYLMILIPSSKKQ